MISYIQAMFDARFGGSEKGATAVEYGLIIALIAVAIIAAVTLLGGNLGTMFNAIATRLGGVVVPG